MRMVFAVGPGFEKFELGALAQDTKAGVTLGLEHPHAWKRTALVTDVDWIAKALHMFAWMGEDEHGSTLVIVYYAARESRNAWREAG